MRIVRWGIASVAGAAVVAAGWVAINGQGQAKPLAPARSAPGAASRPIVLAAATEDNKGPSPRVETTSYGSWVVTCRYPGESTADKSCLATMTVANRNRQPVLNWQIGQNEDGRYITAVSAPTGLTLNENGKAIGGSLLIPDGVGLQFGAAGPVKVLKFASCGPQRCLAEGPVDRGFEREAVANSTATLTVHVAGGVIPFKVSITGIDKALAATRK